MRDVGNQVDLLEDMDTHLLGSIVCLTRPHCAGVNELEVVDGQQRLTTISILFHCIKQRFERESQDGLAVKISQLLTAEAIDGKILPKINLDSIDANEFSRLLKGRQVSEFKNKNLVSAFSKLRVWVDGQTIENLNRFSYKLQNQTLIIRLGML